MKRLVQTGARRLLIAAGAIGLVAAAGAATPPISLLPEKIAPVIADRQNSQTPDVVQLGGWIGSRILANETNRLAKIDPERLLEGYRHRPGRQTWDGEHVGKWLHAATLAWANTGDPALRKKLDYVAVELAKCQLADGYLGTYIEAERWTMWDVWAHKYNLLGLLTYMRYTGDQSALPTCRRMADLLCRTFGEGPDQRDINLAGQHLGMAPTSVLEPMVLLYRFTGEPRYLEFCKYILRAWEKPDGAKAISTLLNQKRMDKVGNGKAYEMLSCLNGALEYYRTTGDKDILTACLNGWSDVVDKRLYLTGTASYREFFHDDHDLPNINNVGETCVTVTWLQFNAQLLRLTGESRFAEELERTTLNQLFGAQCPDGSGWGYYVQMQGKKPYSSTLDGHCCLSSGPRGVALIPTFGTTTDSEGVVINLYETGTAHLRLAERSPVTVTTTTRYPTDESIRFGMKLEAPKTFTVKLRIPEWCKQPVLRVNGKGLAIEKEKAGYALVRREWRSGDEMELRLPLVARVELGANVNDSRLAVLYGPLVLAADEALAPSTGAFRELGVPSRDLAALKFTPEPAADKFASWNNAQVFRVNATYWNGATGKPGPATTIRLVPFADAGASGSAYKIWLPYRAPQPGRNLLADGVEIRSRKPNQGSIIDGRVETLASTFNNKRAPDDWFGVQLESPVTVERIVFAHGKNFHDGGWFNATAGKPRVQVQTTAQGPWETVGELKDYPATTATSPAGLKGGARFEFRLAKPQAVAGVRVVGKPASGDNPKQAFASCAELEAFAADH